MQLFCNHESDDKLRTENQHSCISELLMTGEKKSSNVAAQNSNRLLVGQSVAGLSRDGLSAPHGIAWDHLYDQGLHWDG